MTWDPIIDSARVTAQVRRRVGSEPSTRVAFGRPKLEAPWHLPFVSAFRGRFVSGDRMRAAIFPHYRAGELTLS
jgi:hypothetical protein